MPKICRIESLKRSLLSILIGSFLLLTMLVVCVPVVYGQAPKRSAKYDALQKHLAAGWNTWDVHSVTTHVLLPAGLAIRVGVHRKTTLNGEAFRADSLIGRQGQNVEQVFPRAHAWDGSYTDLRLSWQELDLRIQSAHAGEDLVILVTPLSKEKPGHLPATVVFSAAYLWNRPGTVARLADKIEANGPTGTVDVYAVGAETPFSAIPVIGPYLSAEFTGPVGLSTGKRRNVSEIETILEEQHRVYERSLGTGRPAVVDAIQTTLGWDTIYEPEHDRVISPVSRVWSVDWGGYVLFDWDNFFLPQRSQRSEIANSRMPMRSRRFGKPLLPDSYRITRGREIGRVSIVPSLRWGASRFLVSIEDFTIGGFWKKRSRPCSRGTAGGSKIAA